jgi:hypothetical protein
VKLTLLCTHPALSAACHRSALQVDATLCWRVHKVVVLLTAKSGKEGKRAHVLLENHKVLLPARCGEAKRFTQGSKRGDFRCARWNASFPQQNWFPECTS